MTWIALADHDGGDFDPRGLGRGGAFAREAEVQGLLTRGSLVLETRLSPEGRPQMLLRFGRVHPWPAELSVQAIPGGSVALILAQGSDMCHAVLPLAADSRTDILRITYSWDAPARWGRLAIERPESARALSVETAPPPPLMLEDLRAMACQPRLREMDPDLLYFAVSDAVEPLGPQPALSAHVPVATDRGYRAAGSLRRGDVVITEGEDGPEGVPVLESLSRLVPARGAFRPVRLRAPYFGLRQDIVVAPEQRLLIRGSEVEYMFGTEAVLVPARHLINGTAARWEEAPQLIRYCQLVLPGHEPLMAAGAAVESLYLGRIRRRKDALAASLLADVPRHRLPDHARPAYPVLSPFDAITLAQNRAA
ncbi:hypothetical protein E0K89_003005 [Aquicoccus sp. SCR17]|nr:hypothetical protein [Carideicomes alvinocaridis]